MKALITGASSGIGYEMALYLSKLGYEIIAVARRMDLLEKLEKEAKTKIKKIELDLSKTSNCHKLYNDLAKENINILVNNAGFGVFGDFTNSDLNKEINMIDTNITAVHILTKLFLKDMKNKDQTYILNVASAAAFTPGPLMAAYYATKAYVYRLTLAISYENKQKGYKTHMAVLCPGPVKTGFNDVAKVKFAAKALESSYVAKYAIDELLKKKLIIKPGIGVKVLYHLVKFVPIKLLMKLNYKIQSKKGS